LRFKQVFDAKHGHLYKFTPEGMSVHKTQLRKIKRPVYSWRDLAKKTHTPKATRQTSLVVPKAKRVHNLEPSIDFSMPEDKKHTQTEVDWEACYGDWRSWSKKSKEVQQ